MKNKFKKYSMLFFMLLICIMCFIGANVKAATSLGTDELIKVNNKTITKTTTISQINNMFGNYKVETDNAFGGKTYSYYDDNYTWYLVIETDSSGAIKGYGAIGGDFIAKRYAYGDADDSYYWYLSGTIIKEWDDSAVYGIYEYNCTNSDIEGYWERYELNPAKHLYDLQKHSAVASKVLAVREGYEFEHTYASEDVFYINEQLKYNGSNYYQYAVNNSQLKSIVQISSRTDEFYSDLPNPIRLGKMTEGYEYSSAYKYVLYDIEMKDYTDQSGYIRMFYISPDFLAERKTIELLTNEKTKLEAVKEQHEIYQQYGEAIDELYITEPNYSSLPLVAGEYSKNALLSVTAYLNIARVGMGMGAVTLDEEIASAAQHKSVLVRYMNGQGMSAGHFPTQPDGVSDEFYGKAQSYMNENLYTGTIQSSIDNALNDGYGDPIQCGHRYNLLYPGYTKWGVGSAGGQGTHKLSGTASFDTEIVAWPSNGIFPIDMVYNGIGNWTAQFYKNYAVTSDTEVTIKCLNTDTTYQITNENKNQNGKLLRISGNHLVTFRDDNITYQNGDVFEITLHNVKNSNDEMVDYTYRSVFTSLYQLDSVGVQDINLSSTSIDLNVGQVQRIYATIAPENASNKLIRFTSLNEDVASVRQDGTITALQAGNAQIKVSGSGVEKIINVSVEEVQIEKGDINKDGLVDSADAAIALNLFKYNNATSQDLELGDMDENGIIDSADAAVILNVFKYNQ